MTRRGVVALALIAFAPPVAAQRLVYEGGVTASTGEYYFTERTTTFSLSNGLSVRGARWTLRAGIPVWMQNTTLITASGIGGVPTGGPGGQSAVRDSGQARERRKQGGNGGPGGGTLHRIAGTGVMLSEGAIPAPDGAITGHELRLGDPVVGATLRVTNDDRLTATIGASVKAPVASTTLGTGKWDYGASVSFSAVLGRNVLLGADLGYWHLGDLDSLELRDPLVASASIGTLLGTHWAAMAGLMGSTTAIEGFDGPASVTVSLSRISDDGGTWGFGVAAGLTEASPDAAISINWSVPLSRHRSP